MVALVSDLQGVGSVLAAAKRTTGRVAMYAMFAALLPTVASGQSGATLEVQADTAAQVILRSAESRLASNDAAGAWALLAPREAELAGNPYFDYLLGIAALDTGRTSEAIFSLQRSLAVEPGFSGARMELARAYFESGNTDQARPLFVTLLGENPPPGVRDVLNRYIATIDAGPASPAARFTPFAEVTAGYDSNANGSTADNQFLGFTLSPQNVETDSPFGEVAVGFMYSRPNGNQTAWYLGGRAGHRHNSDASFIDSSVVSGVGGLSWRRGATFGRAGVDGYWSARDGHSNESYVGADLLVGRSVSDRWDLSLGVRTGAVRYDDLIEVLDVNRLLARISASYRFSSLGSVAVELIGGQDDEQQAGSPYGNNKFGGRVSLNAPVGEHSLFLAAGVLTSDYDGLFYGVPREDDQLTAMLQLEFRDVMTDGLSMVPRVRYVNNDSDVALYSYDRFEFGLMLRWMPQ